MPTPALTAAICFANEGDEVERTVRGIRETAGHEVDILLINDASDDDVDYETVAHSYGCRYMLNEARVGPAHSRHKGARWARTENVLFLDAHVRFYASDWHRIINDTIAADPKALYCALSRPLRPATADRDAVETGAPLGRGASVKLLEATFTESLKPEWNQRPLGDTGTAYVPCVLGGCYAMRRDFLMKIGGYRGLHRYGGEEPLISIKAWLAGGSCQLINEVEIGHIYRDSRGAPWVDHIKYQHFNKLATARILMGDKAFAAYWALLATLPTAEAEATRKVYESRRSFTAQAHRDFEAIRRHPIDYFYALNDAFLKGEAIKPEAPAWF
ncbi:glycosyltransferase [Kordiimonas marina]|uniref:glycosyltransferase n=1 Tax=Kordiimonas marina TaxID=2872312 RepID=UPI001FF6C788|nr:glycosyltransferase [Kordiimonas marina]MCJ9428450.1 glycosyltransferase [Kordiimonas marina]